MAHTFSKGFFGLEHEPFKSVKMKVEYICMGPLMVTFSKTQNNVTTAAFAAWTLQCHYGVTTMSLQRHYKAAETASSTKVGIPTLLKSFARFQSQTAFSKLK